MLIRIWVVNSIISNTEASLVTVITTNFTF